MVLTLAIGLLLAGSLVFAANATWSVTANGDWNQASNWTPATVPNGPADTATFTGSFGHAISLSASTEVDRIVFAPAATIAYTITTPPAVTFNFSGVGITNNAPVVESFVTTASLAFSGLTRFTNNASAGVQTSFISAGGDGSGFGGGTTQFRDTTTAGFAVFNANAGTVNGALGGIVEFRNNATGGNGTFTAKGGAVTNAVGGVVQFFDTATAGSGAFTTNGSSVVNGNGAVTQFFNSSTGGSATFVNNGGTASDASRHCGLSSQESRQFCFADALKSRQLKSGWDTLDDDRLDTGRQPQEVTPLTAHHALAGRLQRCVGRPVNRPVQTWPPSDEPACAGNRS